MRSTGCLFPLGSFTASSASTPLALRILGFPEDAHISRRWFYLVPDRGEPRKLVHRIEAFQLDHLPGSQRVYLKWSELKSELARLLSGHDRGGDAVLARVRNSLCFED